MTQLVAEHDNLLLLRTLSKGYSLAGLRVGFLLGDMGLVAPILDKTRDSFNVDAVAQHLAGAAFADEDYARDCWQRVRVERQRLARELRALGFAVPESQANFVLAEAPAGSDAAQLQRQLRERKLLVRYFDQPRLQRCLRITVGMRTDNNALLAALATLV